MNVCNQIFTPELVNRIQEFISANPFNPSTTISYTLQKPSEVKIGVYDLLGHEVAMLVNGMKPAGTNTVQFDGSNLSSGIYIYKLQTVDQVMNRKMMLLK